MAILHVQPYIFCMFKRISATQLSFTSLLAAPGRVELESVSEQRSHFRSDWHRYNLKRKLDGHPPLDEAAFEELLNNPQDEVSACGTCTHVHIPSDAL